MTESLQGWGTKVVMTESLQGLSIIDCHSSLQNETYNSTDNHTVEEEQESLDIAVTMSDAITRLLNQELDNETD